MVTQEQVLKANPLVLHNQSLLMARQRALSMQTLCWHPIPSAPGLQLCYFPEEQQFPVPAQGSVAFQGLLTARFYTGVKAATECGCQQAPCSQGHSQGSCQAAPTCGTRAHSTPGATAQGGGQIKPIMIMRV